MILACLVIIGVLAAATGAMAVLYVLERKDTRTKHEDSRNEDAVGQALTPEGVADAVRCLGYVPVMQDDHVEFRISGQPYRISTKDLPVLKIETSFAATVDNPDYDILLNAAFYVSHGTQELISMFPSCAEQGFRIRSEISAFEPDSTRFRESLIYYINLIHDCEDKFCDYYDEHIDKKIAFKELADSYLNLVDMDAMSRRRPS